MKGNFPPKNVQQSVYATAAFFDVFDRPLQRREFFEFLLGPQLLQEDIDEFLRKDAKLGRRDEYYFLPGRENLIHVRAARDAVSDLYWKRVWRYVPKLQMVPFIKAVAVCNTLAIDNCTTDSDIDLFIITKRGRIFTARVFATLLFHLLGVRRHGNKVAGRFCLSFYVSEDGMNLEKMQLENDVYLYYWMRSLDFVYRADDQIYRRFYRKNPWFTASLPYGPGDRVKSRRRFLSRFVGRFFEFLLGGFLGSWFERFLEKKHLSRFEARRKKLGPEADVAVSRTMLKFHNIDRRREYNEQFFERYNALL